MYEWSLYQLNLLYKLRPIFVYNNILYISLAEFKNTHRTLIDSSHHQIIHAFICEETSVIASKET